MRNEGTKEMDRFRRRRGEDEREKEQESFGRNNKREIEKREEFKIV